MNLPIMEQTFISAKASFAEAKAVILGCPYDGSATFRPGARFGPSAIRKTSWGIETYSPYQESDLTQIKIHDMGDLELPLGEKKTSLSLIQEGARRILSAKKFPIFLGGDHLITLPIIEEIHRVYPDVHVLHIDAHTDLREEYLGETLNHSTVMKKVLDLLSKGRLSQVGIRSGAQEEFALAEKIGSILFSDPKSLRRMVNRLKNRPVYISLDLDVMDPGLLPGVGTPEPGGFTFQEILSLFKGLQPLRVIGFDLVELTPDYDPSQISSVTASVILREMILAFCSR
ncbi:MAG: agmatinase [Deltaproteobacteria bacterium RBG_16_49_23]|nr:MAG: agmatinase [Deltaproteobacteria bacterium RBG_16_49_23]